MEALEDLVAMLVPMTAIVMGIGMAAWSTYLDHQKKRLQYQERQLMIEKGMVPPPQLPDDGKRTGRTPEDCLRRGIVLVSLAIGLAAASIFLANAGGSNGAMRGTGVAAAIVGSLGIGNLVYYFIARRKPQEAQTL